MRKLRVLHTGVLFNLNKFFSIMAKHLVQFILAGAQIVTRAFANAVRQEIRMSQEAAKRHAGGHSKSLIPYWDFLDL